MMDESLRLLTFQQQLEKDAPTLGPVIGLSVNETIKTCIVNGIPRKADKIKSDWKVPDKRCVSVYCNRPHHVSRTSDSGTSNCSLW